MAAEAELQKKVIQFLKKKGCFVMKITPGPGIPKGTPDICIFRNSWVGFLEVKASMKAKFQPGQKETLSFLGKSFFARVITPEDYDKIIEELVASWSKDARKDMPSGRVQ